MNIKELIDKKMENILSISKTIEGLDLSKELLEEVLINKKYGDEEVISKTIIKKVEVKSREIIGNILTLFDIFNEWTWDFDERDQEELPFSTHFNIYEEQNQYFIKYIPRCAADDMKIFDKNGKVMDLRANYPMRWLYEENYKAELTDGFKKYQEYAKNKIKDHKQRNKKIKDLRNQYLESAKSKLSQEELWAFKLINMPKTIKALIS